MEVDAHSDDEWVVLDAAPKLLSTRIETNVENRYAKTRIVSKMENVSGKAQEATFSIITPDQAYISGFTLEIDGKQYESKVQEKKEAKETYDREVSRGRGAAHVATSARDSNRFTVSVNIEPQSKAAFYLRYEELLVRKNNKYEIVLNMNPGQYVEDFEVVVNIKESRAMKFIKIPHIRSGNETMSANPDLDPEANVQTTSEYGGTVTFKPTIAKQKSLSQHLHGKEQNGLTGQFVVQYDVVRDPQGGQVLVDESGYFVHFFAPDDLPPLNKQVIFVLDVSGSMSGRKIEQLKEAMNSILSELRPQDTFSIVEFNSTVSVWNVEAVEVTYQEGNDDFGFHGRHREPKVVEEKKDILPPSIKATPEIISNAKRVIGKLEAVGGTDIKSALKLSLKIINKTTKDDKLQPIIVFLTDGEPTVGETVPKQITSKITELNSKKIPIFTLSFGDGADRDFLQKLSLNNQAFSKHIYEAADASLQLEDFYKEISSPLLSNVNFKYVNNVKKVIRTHFPILFDGSELYTGGIIGRGFQVPQVIGWGLRGEIHFQPTLVKVTSSLERLWAYLTIKKLLEQNKIEDKKSLTEKALKLALKYSFVTDVSSLVVVKPDSSSAVDTEDASRQSSAKSSLMSLAKHKGFWAPAAKGMSNIACFSSAGIMNTSATTGFSSAGIMNTSATAGFARCAPPMCPSNLPGFGGPPVMGFEQSFQDSLMVEPNSDGFGCTLSLDSIGVEAENLLKCIATADSVKEPTVKADICEIRIEPAVLNGYETTVVTGRIMNNDKSTTASASFPIILPDGAFISGGYLEVNGQRYEAYIEKKDDAKNTLDNVTGSSKDAAYVKLKEGTNNTYIVTVVVSSGSEAFVRITYEKLLIKVSNKYQLFFIVLPDHLGGELSINVNVKESHPIKFIDVETEGAKINENSTSLSYDENVVKQKVLAGGPEGVQFTVTFEVESDP